MCYDDFFDELTEFDERMAELKEMLKKSVKEEFLSKIECLEKEIADLSDIKKNWNEKLRELNNKVAKANWEKEDAIRNAEEKARKARLEELLQDIKAKAWIIDCEYEYIHEKCDKCDENGKIHFKSPQGNELSERCECRKRKRNYFAKEINIYSMNFENKKLYAKYEYHSMCYEENLTYYDDFSDDKPYDDLSFYQAIFISKEKAQAYCDYLNSEQDT